MEPTDASLRAALAVLGAAACALLALTENFGDLPAALVAFAAAHHILRL